MSTRKQSLADSISVWREQYRLRLNPSYGLKRYRPPVARVDNIHGDKNVMCACIPVDAHKDEVEA